jgi:hypothetical protein
MGWKDDLLTYNQQTETQTEAGNWKAGILQTNSQPQPQQTKKPFLERVGNVFSSIGQRFGPETLGSVGGSVQALGELPSQGDIVAPMSFKKRLIDADKAQRKKEGKPIPGLNFYNFDKQWLQHVKDSWSAEKERQKTGWNNPLQPVINLGEAMVETGQERSQNALLRNDIKPGTPEEFWSNLGSSGLQVVPGTALSVLTKNPAPLMAISGAQSFGSTYGEKRQAGVDPTTAFNAAAGSSIVDSVAEKVPIGMLLKPGKGYLKSVFKQAITEGAEETISEALKIGIDRGIVGENMNLADAWKRIQNAGISGLTLGGIMSGAAHPAMINNTAPQTKTDTTAPEIKPVAQETVEPEVKPVRPTNLKIGDIFSDADGTEWKVTYKSLAGYEIERVGDTGLNRLINSKTVTGKELRSMAVKKIDPKVNNRPAQTADQPAQVLPNQPSQTVVSNNKPTPDQPIEIQPLENRTGSAAADVGGYAQTGPQPQTDTKPPSTNVRRGTVENEIEPGYSLPGKTAIELPEIVEISKDLMNGKVPHIKERLGDALGKFYPNQKGKMDLRADIFAGPRLATVDFKPKPGENPNDAFTQFKQQAEAQFGGSGKELLFKKTYNNQTGKFEFTVNERDPSLAPKVLAHEIGHLADWLPDHTMKRGNILGRIASLKSYMGKYLAEHPGESYEHLTPEDIQRLQKQAHQLTIEEKRGQVKENESDVKPEDILAIFNTVSGGTKNPVLLDYIKKLSPREKVQVVRDAKNGMVKFSLHKKLASNFADWTAREKAIFTRLMREELRKRQAFERWQITKELQELSQAWKPFDPRVNKKYTAYRNQADELYADAISVLFNDPALLREKAPTFEKGFFNYLERKPEFKAVYEEIQNRLANPEAVGKNRLAGVREMLQEGNELRKEAVVRAIKKPRGVIDSLEKLLVDRDHGLLKMVRQGKKQGGTVEAMAKKAAFELEETKYLAAEVNDYVTKLNSEVLKPLSESGITAEDMGVYMLAKRASTERATLANPRGLDEKAALRMLDDLKKELGDREFQNLETAVNSYRKLRETAIIPRVEKAGMYAPELLQTMKDSKDYAKFSVQAYLEGKFGGAGSARVYEQIGTIADIENPFIATVLQDVSMIRAAKINEAKTAAIDFLNTIDGVKPAEMVFSQDVGGDVAKDPPDPDYRIMSVLNDGKMESYYVHKDIAESYERNPFEATKLAEFAQYLTRPIKEIMVSKNPIWMVRNIVRDVKATIKNVPEIRLRDIPKLGRYYNQAFREVWREAMKGERSEDISAMMRGYMLNENRQYSGKDRSFDTEIERMINDFRVNPGAAIKAEGMVGKFKKVWDTLERLGRVSELTGKVAGYKYLKENSKLSDQEIGHVVRTRIGTPDAKRQGALYQLTNNIFMFSNIGKEGIRSTVESFNADRGAYVWKTMMINVLPKLALIGAAAFGNEALKQTINKIPEYDKQMYDIIPLGTNREGKAVYLRIPQDYEGQMWGAIAWALAGGKFVGARGVLDVVGEQSPYSLNPIITIAGDLYKYYVKGQNPTDDYRGRPVIPEKAYTAGGLEASKYMLQHAWQNAGLNAIYTPGSYSDRSTTTMEGLLKLPGLNVLGAFLKVSDSGELERYYEQEAKEKQANARRLLKIENMVIKSVKSKDGLPVMADIMATFKEARKDGLISNQTSFPEFRNQYLRYASKAVSDSDLKLLLKASKADRKELLLQFKQSKPEAVYRELIRKLNRMGVAI